MQITFRAETTYSDGTTTEELTMDVPEAPPRVGDDLDNGDLSDWADEFLLSHTGDGQHPGEDGLYEVEVLACPERPDLVGYSTGAQG
ncbi:hypothetical protein ACT17_14725 [Mycolicibacterium conceptionense]|uniref:Uncharacterized protein n=1 Tax=Mycolicibacterium conceptionense TaxID=451644 RepID=A0A0J8U7Q4_9MYCO|nr:hypothetical protein [Mycolicibacterium conceptionense]KMV17548.1 hypothetical protein ACT17_14725 [Mycolicibacterium conceptionense]